MIRATTRLEAGSWNLAEAADRLRLDRDRRHRRRLLLTTVAGLDILLDLPAAVALRDGDGLQLADGRILLIEAAEEPVLEITAADTATLIRIAWHLGNRHTPTQLLPGALRIRADHVLAEMAEGLGGTVTALDTAFDPESGAYAGSGGGHGHHHHHDEDEADHGHGHGHQHAHGHDHHGHGHDHGHGHGHSRDHGRDHSHGHGDHDHDHEHGHSHAPGHKHA